MKKIVAIVAVAAMLVAGSVMAADYSPSALLSNTQTTVAAGAERSAGHTTMFESAGLQVGIPVRVINGIVIGAQAGGDVALSEKTTGAKVCTGDATAGLFARNVVVQGYQTAEAALFNYDRTVNNLNLASFNPIAGVVVTSKDEAGITGDVALNKDHGTKADQDVYGFWTRSWTQKIVSQARFGEQFGCGVKGGGSLEYRLTPNISVVAAADTNVRHDTIASISFVLGNNKAALQQIQGTGLKPMGW